MSPIAKVFCAELLQEIREKNLNKFSFGFGVSNKIYGSTEIGEKGGGGRSAIEMLNQSTNCSHYSEMISSLSFAGA